MENDNGESEKSLDHLLGSVEQLRNILKKRKTAQVRTSDEKELVQAISLNWFKESKNKLPHLADKWEIVAQLNEDFKTLDKWSRCATSRDRYVSYLQLVRARVIQLRLDVISSPNKVEAQKKMPDIEKLISDSTMRQIIYRRWEEIEKCVENAPLACVVMIGALLEALLLARINKLDDKSVIFKLKATPKDKVSGKPLALTGWTLSHFIAVAHEMGWIRKPARDVSTTIMEYRNLIHPEKQWRLGIIIEPQDSRMFFAIFDELSKQIVESVSKI